MAILNGLRQLCYVRELTCIKKWINDGKFTAVIPVLVVGALEEFHFYWSHQWHPVITCKGNGANERLHMQCEANGCEGDFQQIYTFLDGILERYKIIPWCHIELDAIHLHTYIYIYMSRCIWCVTYRLCLFRTKTQNEFS